MDPTPPKTIRDTPFKGNVAPPTSPISDIISHLQDVHIITSLLSPHRILLQQWLQTFGYPWHLCCKRTEHWARSLPSTSKNLLPSCKRKALLICSTRHSCPKQYFPSAKIKGQFNLLFFPSIILFVDFFKYHGNLYHYCASLYPVIFYLYHCYANLSCGFQIQEKNGWIVYKTVLLLGCFKHHVLLDIQMMHVISMQWSPQLWTSSITQVSSTWFLLSIIISFSSLMNPVCTHLFKFLVHKSSHGIIMFIRLVTKAKNLSRETDYWQSVVWPINMNVLVEATVTGIMKHWLY